VKHEPTLLVPISMRDIPVESMEVEVPEYVHPVTNEYLPSLVQGEIILRKEGDLSGKVWDEEALRRWEEIENGGRAWEGRPSRDY